MSARREHNFCVLPRVRTERCPPPTSLFPALSAPRGRKARIRQHLCQQSELWGHPACYKHQTKFHLIYWATVTLLDTSRKSYTSNSWPNPCFRKTLREDNQVSSQGQLRGSCMYLSMGWTVGQSWTGSEQGTVDNFWVLLRVILWNGASEFCGKEDMVLFNQKSWNPNASVLPELLSPFPGWGVEGGGGGVGRNQQLLLMEHEPNHHARRLGVFIYLFNFWPLHVGS